MTSLVPVLLSGGSGTRLWPQSRRLQPKQFNKLFSEYSLFQEAALRCTSANGMGAPIVVCNEDHRFLVLDQLGDIGITPRAVILEPVGRNTAPAIAAAAYYLEAEEPGALVAVFPSDHRIPDGKAFKETIAAAVPAARAGRLVTFGIEPRFPSTAFGYIRRGDPVETGVCRIAEFIEKPPAEKAQAFLESGEYLWNSGMFVFLAAAYLDELARLEPEAASSIRNATTEGCRDLSFLRLKKSLFVAAPNVSIDDAVFERTALGAVVQTPLRWSDVGTWDAVWRDAPKDENGIASFGDTVVDGCKDSLIYATSRLVSVSGLTDVAVVETSDAIFVAPRQAAHEAAKGVVEHLKKNGREEGDLHTTVYRPWGHYETLSTGNGYKVKRLFVKPGGKLSLQRHLHRAEHWVVTRGSIVVTLSGQTHALSANKSFFVDRGAVHRIENKTQEDAELIEVQTGDLLEENDIERLDDVYGR